MIEIHILNARKNYGSIENLNDLDYQIFSQNGRWYNRFFD